MNIATSYAAMVAAACCIVFASCESNLSGPDLVGGLYTYTAFNTADSAVVTGTITLRNPDSTALTGTWDLRSIRNAGEIGPQVGLGTLTGTLAGGVSIDLNPSMADNNVVLTGTRDDGEITGTWQWVTLSGVTAAGRFEMIKR